MYNIQVLGVERINELMTRLGRAFTDKELDRAQRVGLRPTLQEMQHEVRKHNKTEALYSSIAIEKDRQLSKFGKPVTRVGRRIKKGSWKGMGRHAHLLEYGTKPHTIKSKTGKMMPIFAKGSSGPVGYAPEIQHPGSRAFHVFSQAISRSEDRSVQATENELWKVIFKEWNKGGTV